MAGWILTFLLLTMAAALMGFSGLAGALTQVAQFLAVVFVVLLVASIFYSIISGRRPRLPLP